MRGFTRDSLVEMIDRKMLWFFGFITVIGLLTVFGLNAVDVEIYGQGVDVGEMNKIMGDPILKGLNMFMYISVFLVVMATAGLIPNMLVKGRAEYYLSKPISRVSLLLNKITAIMIVYGSLMSICFLIVFLATWFTIGSFEWGVVIIIVSNVLQFFIWLSITTFIGVFTGSAAIAIMSAFGIWLIQLILSKLHDLGSILDMKTLSDVLDFIYYIFPKTIEISDSTVTFIDGGRIDWMPVWSSVIFAMVMLFLAVVTFKNKDY